MATVHLLYDYVDLIVTDATSASRFQTMDELVQALVTSRHRHGDAAAALDNYRLRSLSRPETVDYVPVDAYAALGPAGVVEGLLVNPAGMFGHWLPFLLVDLGLELRQQQHDTVEDEAGALPFVIETIRLDFADFWIVFHVRTNVSGVVDRTSPASPASSSSSSQTDLWLPTPPPSSTAQGEYEPTAVQNLLMDHDVLLIRAFEPLRQEAFAARIHDVDVRVRHLYFYTGLLPEPGMAGATVRIDLTQPPVQFVDLGVRDILAYFQAGETFANPAAVAAYPHLPLSRFARRGHAVEHPAVLRWIHSILRVVNTAFHGYSQDGVLVSLPYFESFLRPTIVQFIIQRTSLWLGPLATGRMLVVAALPTFEAVTLFYVPSGEETGLGDPAAFHDVNALLLAQREAQYRSIVSPLSYRSWAEFIGVWGAGIDSLVKLFELEMPEMADVHGGEQAAVRTPTPPSYATPPPRLSSARRRQSPSVPLAQRLPPLTRRWGSYAHWVAEHGPVTPDVVTPPPPYNPPPIYDVTPPRTIVTPGPVPAAPTTPHPPAYPTMAAAAAARGRRTVLFPTPRLAGSPVSESESESESDEFVMHGQAQGTPPVRARGRGRGRGRGR